jgi:Ca-activated chloride channel family protein
MGDYYDRLGVSRRATAEEIREAYFDLARTTHPDANSDPAAVEAFLEIQEAYETLRDPGKRRNYDQFLPADLKKDPRVAISVKYSKSAIAPIQEPQLIYALLDVECLAGREEVARPQKHICFVIDRSTSMQGKRMAMVKANLLKILPEFAPNDLISIVTFSDRPEILCASASISQKDAIIEKVEQIDCSGSTEIYQGLKAGTDLLRLTGISNPIRHLILLTDGHTYGDEENCIRLSKEAFELGIMFNAMGIGSEWNDTFLDLITSLTGGTTVFIKSEEDLYQFICQKINSSSYTYASNMRLEYKSDSDVTLKTAFRIQPEFMPLETGDLVALGDIFYESKSQFLLEFMIQPLKKGKGTIHLSRGSVKMDIHAEENREARVKLNLCVKIDENAERENPPLEIVRALSRLTLYHMQEKNRVEVGNGDYKSAVKRMHYLASKMLTRGDRNLARQILLEAEQINNSKHFSQEGEKRIKYGTKNLFLLPGPEPRIS